MRMNFERKVAGIMLKDKDGLLSENLFEDVPDESEDFLGNEIYEMMMEFVKEGSITDITRHIWKLAVERDGLNPAQATDRTLTEMANYLLYSTENQIMVYKELITLNQDTNYDKFDFPRDLVDSIKTKVLKNLNKKGKEAQAAYKIEEIF